MELLNSNKFTFYNDKGCNIVRQFHTRIAPSPTGFAHIGTVRTALFNWLVARATGGTFTLRIDDTDVARNNEEAVQPIYDALAWLGLNYDNTFRQSDRIPFYKEVARILVEQELAIKLDNGAIALKWHSDMPRMWHDNLSGDIPITDTNIEQIDGRTILLKGDEHNNAPLYQFTSTYDDWDTGINYIIRGVDHVTNTAKQMAIWWALNKIFDFAHKPFPEFAHIGLIFKDGKKLSKREGAASALWFKDEGYSSEALFAFLLRLGWSPKVDDKDSYTMSPEQAISQFLTAGRMRNSNAQLDMKKLDSIQKKFMAKQRTSV